MSLLFRKASEISITSVIITDANAKILYVNNAFTENTGYTEEEVLDKNPRILKSSHSDELVDYADMWKTLLDGKEWNGELYNKDKFGEHFWEFARIAPVIEDDVLYYVAVKQNITRLKLLEEKLTYLCDKAECLSNL